MLRGQTLARRSLCRAFSFHESAARQAPMQQSTARQVQQSAPRKATADLKPAAVLNPFDVNGDGKVDFDDVKFVMSEAKKKLAAKGDRQGKYWAAIFGTAFFVAYGGLQGVGTWGHRLKLKLNGEDTYQTGAGRASSEKFFKWGGVYSRFHPETGSEVSAKWGVKLSGPKD